MTLDFNEEYKKELMVVYQNPSKEFFGKDVDFWMDSIIKGTYSDRRLVELVFELASLRELVGEFIAEDESGVFGLCAADKVLYEKEYAAHIDLLSRAKELK